MVTVEIKDQTVERGVFTKRVIIAFGFSIFLFLVLVVRLFQLQVIEHKTYQTRSDKNRIEIQAIPPLRGSIFDRNGVLLADNQPLASLSIVREHVTDIDVLIQNIDDLVGVNEREFEDFNKRLRRSRRPFESVTLKESLTDEQIAIIRVNSHRLPGVEVDAEVQRYYPFGEIFAHAIGSVRRITEDDLQNLDESDYRGTKFIGRLGVESHYEAVLHGQIGHRQVEVDVVGRIARELDVEHPVAGQNLTLHLDSRLQIAAHSALVNRRGAIVALDPRSGGILAMVSVPSYDPNLFVGGMTEDQYSLLTASRDLPLFNRAIRGQYAPGSTFKPIVGLAGISYGVTNWQEEIEDRGWLKLPNQDRIYRDWSWKKDNSGGQGIVDLHRAIYRSSNVYFYSLGTRLNINQLSSFARQFGYGQRTAIDVSGTASGVLPSVSWKREQKGEPWYPGDTVNMSIGQGDLLATPLQVATVSMLIANRGRWVRPRMILSSDSPLMGFNSPERFENVSGLDEEDWLRMIHSMEAVVHRGNRGFRQNGTAWSYIGKNIPYRMAGKSGTAQVVEIKQGEEYDEESLSEYQRKHAWFMAFAPVEAPEIALAVLVENGGGGSSIAAPIARELIDAYLLPQLALSP